MQIQVTSIANGFLVATPKQLTAEQARKMSQEQIQQYMSQPDCTYCEDYEAVCTFIKRFFFSPNT